MKKTLAIVALMVLPAATLGMQDSQNAPQQETAPSTAKSHHSTHHKRSKNAHHKTHKHHTSKQHPQTQ